MPVNSAAMPTAPARTPGRANRRGSSSGSATRSSWRAQHASSTPAAAGAPSTTGLPHPACGPDTIPYSRARNPAVSSALPSGSSGRGYRAVTGVTAAASSSAASASGTRQTNRVRQVPKCRAAPPPTLPRTAASPVIDAQTAIARRRGPSASPSTRSASVVGSTAAAPAPLSIRPAISTPMCGAAAHTAAPAVNTAIPHSSVPLRPRRSASAPAGTSRQAKTTT